MSEPSVTSWTRIVSPDSVMSISVRTSSSALPVGFPSSLALVRSSAVSTGESPSRWSRSTIAVTATMVSTTAAAISSGLARRLAR